MPGGSFTRGPLLACLKQGNAALGLDGDATEPGLEANAKRGDLVVEIVEDALAVVEAKQSPCCHIGRDALAKNSGSEQDPRPESSGRKWSTTLSFSAMRPGRQWST
jgi:hypothetical protein